MRRIFRLALGRADLDRELDEELAFHIEMRVQQLVAAGVPAPEARARAIRQFGDVDAVRRSCLTIDHERERAMRRANLLDEARKDFAYALRALRRNPGFAAVVVLTLGLGIGANTAIFTLIHAVLLRTLPVPHAEQLVTIGDPTRVNSVSMGDPRVDLASYPLYRDLRERQHAFTGLFASGRSNRLDVIVDRGRSSGEPEHPRGRLVSGNYFAVLGVNALRGRTFGADEDGAAGASPVVVISHDWWTRRFDADPGAIGRTITINGAPYTIVGVTPPDFTGEIVGQNTDVWIPLTMQPVIMPNRDWLDDRATNFLLLMGRLAPGMTLERARAEIDALERQLIDASVKSDPNTLSCGERCKRHVPVSSGAKGFSRVRATFSTPLLTLMAGVALLLLIVCANVANLLLARAVAREREMGVRIALGAGRARLVRQLLTESTVLALLGAALGLVVAWWGSQLLLLLASGGPSALPLTVRLDLPVLAFTAGVAIVTVVLFGLIPALRATRIDLATTMRAHARNVSGAAALGGARRVPFGTVLVAAQVALSLLLLVGAGLLVRSLRNVLQTDTGLDQAHLLIVEVDPTARGDSGAKQYALARELIARISQLPGVAAVTMSENGIFSGTESATTVQVEGFTAATYDDSVVNYDQVGPGYFHAIGARLLAGRDMSVQDDEDAPRVVVINETMAHFYFPHGDAIGRHVRVDTASAQIVGVVADAKDHDLKGEPVRRMYTPFFHGFGEPGSLRLEIRSTGDPARLAKPVRAEIATVDPLLPITDVDPLSSLMRESLREELLVTRLASGFGVLALALAAIGLYGVMTYTIARRTGEIGLRMALGAGRADVVRMVLGEALRVVALGIVVGLPVALLSVRLLRSQLYGVGAADPVAIGVALGVLAVSALVAGLVPAVRAARVAPLVALRQE